MSKKSEETNRKGTHRSSVEKQNKRPSRRRHFRHHMAHSVAAMLAPHVYLLSKGDERLRANYVGQQSRRLFAFHYDVYIWTDQIFENVEGVKYRSQSAQFTSNGMC
jgi:hypothetical protein